MADKLIPPSHFLIEDKENVEETSNGKTNEDEVPIDIFSREYFNKRVVQNGTRKLSENDRRRKELENLRAENRFLHCNLAKQKKEGECSNIFNKNNKNTSTSTLKEQQLQNNLSDLTALLLKQDNEISDIKKSNLKLQAENTYYKTICEDRFSEINSLKSRITEKENEFKVEVDKLSEQNKELLRDAKRSQEEIINELTIKCKNFESLLEEVKSTSEQAKLKLETEIQNTKHENETKLLLLKQQHTEYIGNLTKEHEVILGTKKKEYLDVKSQLTNSEENIKILKDEIQLGKSNLLSAHKEISDNAHAFEKLEEDFEIERKNIVSLQSYIHGVQEEDLERSKWKQEKENLENKVAHCEAKTSELEKTLELQLIRFDSIKKVLAMQEEKISTQSKALPTGDLANPEQIVLIKWREKVFELMVQIKSVELVNREDRLKHKLAEDDLKSKVKNVERDSVILSSQLTESNAQIKLSEQKLELANSENKKLKETVLRQDNKISEFEATSTMVGKIVGQKTSEMKESYEKVLCDILAKNSRLEERIVFANNRLRTIKDLISRRQKLHHVKKHHIQKDASTHTADLNPGQNIETFKSEISIMVKERDQLSQKLKEDATLFESATTDFRQQIQSMQNNINDLQKQFESKVEECNDYSTNLKELNCELETCKISHTQAEENYNKLKNEYNNKVEAKLSEKQSLHDKEISELQAKLSDAKTQIAKSLVSARQAERSFTRELKCATDHLQEKLEINHAEIKSLRHKLKQLEQDNNLLMTTLRQEGLISAYKATRAAYKKTLHEAKNKAAMSVKNRTNITTSTSEIESLTKQDNSCDKDPESNPEIKDLSDDASANIEIQQPTVLNDNVQGNVKYMLQELVAMTDDVLKDDT